MWRVAILASVLVALAVVPLSSAALIEAGETVFMPLGDLPGGRAASSALAVSIARYAEDEVIAVELEAGGNPVLQSDDGDALVTSPASSALLLAGPDRDVVA